MLALHSQSRRRCRICLKFTKGSRTTSMISFWCLSFQLLTYFKLCPSISIVDFVHVMEVGNYKEVFFFSKDYVCTLISKEIKNITHYLLLKAHTH